MRCCLSEVDPHRHRADLCAAVLRQRIPAIVAGGGFGALALLVVSALVIGGIYPAIVQQFQVKPSELTKRKRRFATTSTPPAAPTR